MYLLEMFGVSLALTIVLELPIAYLLGLREKQSILLVVLLNILTNPAAVLLCWLGAPQLPVELAVVMVEAAVYYLFLKDGWKISHLLGLSVICNAVSWLTGVLLQRIGG